jgi:hypothetical protein
MCVIFIVNKTRPSDEMVTRAFDHNKDGVGAGWREGDEVCWQKGITSLEDAKKLCRELPLPYVVHFRVASVGGVKQSLTHPFVIGKDASIALEGRTKSGILFHNGHWNDWNTKAMDAAIHSNSRVPGGGDWSDSRAMAWLVHIYGPGFMDLLTSQKAVIMTPKKTNIYVGNGWDKINDVWCSNDYFWKGGRGFAHGGFRRTCSVGRCVAQAQVGKDICESCEKDRAAKAASKDKPSDPDPVAIATGGVKRPLARTLTFQEVEGLRKQGLISKSTSKKFKKWFAMTGLGGNREKRALTALQQLSIKVAEQLIHGSAN